MEKSPAQIAGEFLRDLREDRGLTQEGLAKKVCCSQSLISGLEKAKKTARPEMIASIDEALGARGLLIKLWPVTGSGFQSAESLAGLEAEAGEIDDWEERVIPGLLQSPDYARGVIRAARPWDTEAEIDYALELRLRRQAIFTKPDPPRGWFVFDEAVLYRAFGGKAAMRDQLIKLEESAARPNIIVQVMPFSAVEHPGSSGPLRIMHYSNKPPIWYTEASSSGRMTESGEEVAAALTRFNLIRAAALSPCESARFIRDARGAHYE